MVERPGIEVVASPAAGWSAEGPLARRALRVAEVVGERLRARGVNVPSLNVQIERATPEHVGLGTGTQLTLAITALLLEQAGLALDEIPEFAAASGRGRRSGIGLHGFLHGGLIVDGGRPSGNGVPPLVARHDFPDSWSILIVLMKLELGLHGGEEGQAFSQLPAIPRRVTEELCRLILLGLLPAVAERDIEQFGIALGEVQRRVGECFAPVQEGIYAREELSEMASALQALGLHGVGQSSWGPTLYGFTDRPEDFRNFVISRLREHFGAALTTVMWTKAQNAGAAVERVIGPV
jgi:beta-RFAP synthase